MGWGSANWPLPLRPGEWGMRFPVWFLLVLMRKENACSHYILSRGWKGMPFSVCAGAATCAMVVINFGVSPITEVFAL